MTDISEELAIRFSEYLDGELSDAERAAFEEELVADESLASAFEEFSETLSVLGGMAAPEVDLNVEVQTKIRRRSRGRYFGANSLRRQRVQTEIFIAIALILLAGIALMATPGGLRALLGGPEFELVEDPSGTERGPDEEEETTGDDEDAGGEAPVPSGGLVDPLVDPPSAGLPPAEPGRTTGAPVRPMQRLEILYTVRTELPIDALERRVRDQFGADAVRVENDSVVAAVPRAQVADSVTSVSALGTVHRAREVVEGNPATLDIIFEPGQ